MIYALVRQGGWGDDVTLFQFEGPMVPDAEDVAQQLDIDIEGDDCFVSVVETDLKKIPKVKI